MKKSLSILLTTITLCCLTFMSCTPASSSSSDNNNGNNNSSQNTPVMSKAKYTIMLYGAGGGDLDTLLLQNLQQEESFYTSNPDCNMHITAQFNMSDYDKSQHVFWYQQEGSQYKGTMRWYMTKDGWNKSNNFSTVQTLHNPAVLTDFIKFSVEHFPAEKYILILSDHGSAFNIADQPVDSEVTTINGRPGARSLIYDCNIGNENFPLSVFGIEEGIKNSGIKMDLIYFDCCLMGQIENLYQLRNQTNYTVSSANVSYDSDHTVFLQRLKSYETIQEAMSQYLEDTIKQWKETVDSSDICNFFDIFLTDMSKFGPVIENFKNVKTALIQKHFSTPLTDVKKSEYRNKFKPAEFEIKINGFTETLPEEWNSGELYYYDFLLKKDTPATNTDFEKKAYTSTDLIFTFENLAGDDANLKALVDKLKLSILGTTNEDGLMQYYQYAIRPNEMTSNSLGLTFVDKTRFTKVNTDYKKYQTLQSVYELLDWDKETKWSQFLLANDTAAPTTEQ